MKRILAYLLVILSSVAVLLIGGFVLTLIEIRSNLPMIMVAGFSISTGIYVYRKLKIFKTPTSKELAIYPIVDSEFPIDVLFLEDTVVLSDGHSYKYTGKFRDRLGFDGGRYLELTEDELKAQVRELRNKRIVKWRRK